MDAFHHPHPWDQQQGETDTQYMQFLYYRDLGVRRTVRKAYVKYAREFQGKDGEIGRTPGSFKGNSTQLKWADRAQAYDIWNLRHYGKKVAILFVRNLEMMARKCRRAIRANEVGDVPWPQVVTTMAFIADQLKRTGDAQRPVESVSGGPVPGGRPALPAADANGDGEWDGGGDS